MKNTAARFGALEHPLMMTIAMIIITIGYGKAKRATEGKFKKIFVFYLVTLLVVLAAIPWPFRTALGANWF